MYGADHDGMYNIHRETGKLTDKCPVCVSIRERYKEEHKEGLQDSTIQLHTEYNIIRGKKSKEKSSFLDKVAKAASALRNSGGGVLLVHLEGTSSEDRCLEYFDEFVDRTFTNLLEGGELYTDSYERYFLSDQPTFTDAWDFLVVKVNKTAGLATVDFNTKANTDRENLDINSLILSEVLSKTETSEKNQPSLRQLPQNVNTFHEDRHIQLKAFKDNTEEIKRKQADVVKLTHHIWHNLKLKDNITSMSKLIQGGSYYLGVNEKKVVTQRHYQTKVADVVGFKLHVSPASLIESIYRKVETDLCVLTRKGEFTDAPGDLINIAFHPVRLPELYVLEVAIRYCDGVVFYDKHGPRSYILDEKDQIVRRMTKGEWFQKFFESRALNLQHQATPQPAVVKQHHQMTNMYNGTNSTDSSDMSDNSSDTSVGSSLYQSDEEVMRYFTVGKAKDTDDVACPTPERQVGNDSEQQASGATHGMTEPGHGSTASLWEENIRLRKRIEEMESFDRISLATDDSGFVSEGSSLASSNRSSVIRRSPKPDVNRGGKMKDGLKRFFAFGRSKQKEKGAYPTSVTPVGDDGEHQTSETAQSLTTPVTQNPTREDTDIHAACKEGDLNRLTRILSENLEDVNHREKGGVTPAMIAASLKTDNKNNILHVACIGGHVDMVKYVLSLKVVGINSRGKYGRTPVMVAAEKGHREVFDILVKEGADISLVDDDVDNILYVACIGGHVDMVKYVLSLKVVGINSRGKYGRTPMMLTAEMGHREVFDILVRERADVSLVDDNKNNILHVACIGGNVDMVKYILSLKVVGINSRGKYGRTPVMVAAEKGHREVFDLLVREGADVSLVDDNRNNILHVACIGGHVDMVKYVLSLKVVDINSRGRYGRTPVKVAAEKGHREVCDLLVREGADQSGC